MRSLAVAFLLLASCGLPAKGSRHFRPEVSAPPEAWKGVSRVAVFPPDNWTADVGLEYITWYRAVIHELLREKGYEVAPLAAVNRFMRKNRFIMAGELAQYAPEELAQALEADALLFWDITGPNGRVNVSLVKADGSMLWGTGEIDLRLTYRAVTKGYNDTDRTFALVLGEIFKKLPVKS